MIERSIDFLIPKSIINQKQFSSLVIVLLITFHFPNTALACAVYDRGPEISFDYFLSLFEGMLGMTIIILSFGGVLFALFKKAYRWVFFWIILFAVVFTIRFFAGLFFCS